jgi:hypothetical protein
LVVAVPVAAGIIVLAAQPKTIDGHPVVEAQWREHAPEDILPYDPHDLLQGHYPLSPHGDTNLAVLWMYMTAQGDIKAVVASANADITGTASPTEKARITKQARQAVAARRSVFDEELTKFLRENPNLPVTVKGEK